ncbi:hypothetical protein T440DRAFT_464252 [Plenodomus tracheiphilus IPT5]|uniref:Uncharacterized protein n=1 Tax=Plenodomus tracheiphilus IPT5 TaxID=1408161 RepID=A0A6A7BKH4_9PLEO|nr:hypothetical protein T440DRAFT_464252 [Plenodomus tracheiphilus IPT5]
MYRGMPGLATLVSQQCRIPCVNANTPYATPSVTDPDTSPSNHPIPHPDYQSSDSHLHSSSPSHPAHHPVPD